MKIIIFYEVWWIIWRKISIWQWPAYCIQYWSIPYHLQNHWWLTINLNLIQNCSNALSFYSLTSLFFLHLLSFNVVIVVNDSQCWPYFSLRVPKIKASNCPAHYPHDEQIGFGYPYLPAMLGRVRENKLFRVPHSSLRVLRSSYRVRRSSEGFSIAQNGAA